MFLSSKSKAPVRSRDTDHTYVPIGRSSAAFLCAFVAIIVALILPSIARAQTPSEQPAGIYEAIEELIEATPGHVFAGFCEDLNQTEHEGQWCASLIEASMLHAVVRYGPMSASTSLPPVYFATFERTAADGWLVVSNTSPFASGFEVQAALRAAIRTTVEGAGTIYAGLCNEISPAAHANQVCAYVPSLVDTTAQVSTSANPSPVTFVHRDGTWSPQVEEPRPVMPAELIAAIKSHLQSKGYEYGGLCDEIRVSANSSLWCATVKSLTTDHATIMVGPAAKSDRFTVALTRQASRWNVNSSNVPQRVPTELLSAIKSHVEDRGYEYAGLCEVILVSKDSDAWCGTIKSLSIDDAKVSVGRAAGSERYTIKLTAQGSRWRVSNSDVPQWIPSKLLSAIKSHVEDRGYQYAGLCEVVQVSRDSDAWCGTIKSLSTDDAKISVGRAAGGERFTIKLTRQGSRWNVSSSDVPQRVPGGMLAAIKSHVDSRGYEYAGLCEVVLVSRDSDAWCGTIQTLNINEAVVSVGPAIGAARFTVVLTNRGSHWGVQGSNVPVRIPAPTPTKTPTAEPPVATPTSQPPTSVPIVTTSTPTPQNAVTSPTSTATPTPTSTPTTVVPPPAVTNAPTALQGAIRAYIGAKGLTYAGLCLEIDLTLHVGDQCAFAVRISDTEFLVTYGTVLSDEHNEIVFQLNGGEWAPLHPAESTSSYLVFSVVAVGLVLAGGLGLRQHLLRKDE